MPDHVHVDGPQIPADPQGPADNNEVGADASYSGQASDRKRERAEGVRHPADDVDPQASKYPSKEMATGELPPEAGRRAWVDPKSGEVHGSGSSAGGGNVGEDYDDSSKGGGGYTPTGTGNEPTSSSQD